MFKSGSVAGHLVRGILGFGLLAIALLYAQDLGWWTLAPVVVALVAFRGCPMCWIVGLVETVLQRKTRTACPL
jgi:hypothetical protein